MKIVTTQPAKEGETITVTDKQGRSYSAEATTEIVDNKGIAFREGKIKVTGNNNSTQQSRTVLDRHTPKRKKVETTSPKILSYIEEDGEYKFYIFGDRNPQLIYSLDMNNEIVWGNISTQSQSKGDWVVGILYYNPDLILEFAEEDMIGEFAVRINQSPVNSYVRKGGYVLTLITNNSVIEHTVNNLGLITELMRPCGNGHFYPHPPNEMYRYFLGVETYTNFGYVNEDMYPNLYQVEVRGDWDQVSRPFPLQTPLFVSNYPVINWSLRPVQYTVDFYTLYTFFTNDTILTPEIPLIDSVSIPQLSDPDSPNFFDNLTTLEDWTDGFYDFTPNSEPNLSVFNNSQAVIYADTPQSISDTIYLVPNFNWFQNNTDHRIYYTNFFNTGNISYPPSNTVYYEKKDWFLPFNGKYSQYYYPFFYIQLGNSFYRRYNNEINSRSGSSGQQIVISYQENTSFLLQPLVNIYFNNSQAKEGIGCKRISCQTNEFGVYAIKKLNNYETYGRKTYALRTKVDEVVNIGSAEIPIVYNLFHYKQGLLDENNLYKQDYSIPYLLYYGSPDSLIIGFKTPSETTYQYWNGTNFSEVAVPDNSEYYLELRKGKFQGINAYDLELGKKEVTLHTWTVGSELGTPKTKKIQVKKYPEGHTILSASYG